MYENFLFSSLTNRLDLSEFSVAFTIDLSNGFPPPFVASTTIPWFLFAGEHRVAVFYTNVRVTIQATGRGCHPNLIVERSWRLLRLRVPSQVGVVRIIWYQSFGSSLSFLTNHLNLSEFSVAFTIDLGNGFPPPFVASTTIPRFLFASGHWVAVFYTKFFDEPFELIGIFRGVHYRLSKPISTTVCGVYDNTKVLVCGWTLGRGLLYQGSCHDSSNELRLPSKLVERFWRLLKLRISSHVSVVRIIWYQSFGSSLSSLTNLLNLSEFSVPFTIDLANGFPPPLVAFTTIPRFLFAGGHWVAVFYTKVRVTIQATGCGWHPNL
ncbi:hypothetical protein TIFTF001_049012 [Ficus carica]|uniref:Uncharacterized protein n=1 Tax=Ficus carica TaxID=3494 RepID=A0AA87ZDF1_FICCA|nr:hypothetical protein TIFTF001_049012 [Ficus carica]